MTDLPITPDFANWPKEHSAQQLDWDDEHLSIIWSDGVATEHHVLLLRENSPDPVTLHPKAREMAIAPTDIPADIKIQSGMIEKNGTVLLNFSDGLATAYHPGWLRGTAWTGEDCHQTPIVWRAKDLAAPPNFDGPTAMEEPEVFLQCLEALRDYGVARLRGLPQKNGLLEQLVTRIGPVRESNFGR